MTNYFTDIDSNGRRPSIILGAILIVVMVFGFASMGESSLMAMQRGQQELATALVNRDYNDPATFEGKKLHCGNMGIQDKQLMYICYFIQAKLDAIDAQLAE